MGLFNLFSKKKKFVKELKETNLKTQEKVVTDLANKDETRLKEGRKAMINQIIACQEIFPMTVPETNEKVTQEWLEEQSTEELYDIMQLLHDELEKIA